MRESCFNYLLLSEGVQWRTIVRSEQEREGCSRRMTIRRPDDKDTLSPDA